MVSHGFPHKFPAHQKSFLNSLCRIVQRKQETFSVNPLVLLRFKSFLRWKPFPPQATQSFHYCFLTMRIFWP